VRGQSRGARLRRLATSLLRFRARQALSLLSERGANAPRRALAREILLGVARAATKGLLALRANRLRVARLRLDRDDARALLKPPPRARGSVAAAKPQLPPRGATPPPRRRAPRR
jgi:hypothetical protein